MDKAQEFYQEQKASKEAKREIHPYSMWSFVLSMSLLWGIFLILIPIMNIIFAILVVIALIASIVFGILSFEKINKNPQKYWGKGFSIAGITISVIQFLIGIIALIFVYKLYASSNFPILAK